MKEMLNIKGYVLGNGKPLICIPIVETSREGIKRAAEALAQTPAEMAEWRIDWFEEAKAEEAVCQMAEELAEILEHQILLCTFRSKKQGGEKEINPKGYEHLLQILAKTKKIDMIDVEVCELTNPRGLIKELQQKGVRVIASDHDFAKTPATDIMKEKLLYMKQLGADMAKLAVMPQQKKDVLRLLEATLAVKEQVAEYPLVTMAMGKTGVISRISGEIFGSCITFAAAGKTSAPGQMHWQDVMKIRDKISESLEE